MKQKIRKYIKKITKALMSFVLALVVGLPIFSVAPSAVSTAFAETVNDYDNTNVLDDLGKDVVSAITPNLSASPQLYSVMEYCFSEYTATKNAKYGLYVYIINPARTEYSETLGANRINMATSYTSGGEPNGYEKLKLKFCGHTTGVYDKLVYKFRVIGLDDVVENVTAMNTKNGERRYDFVEIELRQGNSIPKAYSISRTLMYSGYAKGCGTGAENQSTLKCTWSNLETIPLKVNHANYRTGDYDDNDVCSELNTAYFSIPDAYFESYGVLQKIKAEWYEYVTKPIFVTSDSEAYDALYPYIGKYIGEEDSSLSWRVLWNELKMKGTIPGTILPRDEYLFYGVYNETFLNQNSGQYMLGHAYKYLPQMDYIFKRENVTSHEDYSVTKEDLVDWMENYSYRFTTQDSVLVLNNDGESVRYASGLFIDTIDTDRIKYLENPEDKRGYMCREIDKDVDIVDLRFEKDLKWWKEKLLGLEAWIDKSYCPIVDVDDSILSLSIDTFGEEYLIGKTDRQAVYDYCVSELKQGNHPILFRFADTDYYSSTARFDKFGDGSGMSSHDGYVAQETVFLEFDIISLTFRKDNVDKVIGVVADPIDIINGVDAPTDQPLPKDKGCAEGCAGCNSNLLWIVGLALLAPIWVPLLPYLFKVLGWIITAPFKFIGWLWGLIFKKRE